MKGILIVGLLLRHMLALFSWLYYMFDVYEKPNFYFTYYSPFIAFKHNSFLFWLLKYVPTPLIEFGVKMISLLKQIYILALFSKYCSF